MIALPLPARRPASSRPAKTAVAAGYVVIAASFVLVVTMLAAELLPDVRGWMRAGVFAIALAVIGAAAVLFAGWMPQQRKVRVGDESNVLSSTLSCQENGARIQRSLAFRSGGLGMSAQADSAML